MIDAAQWTPLGYEGAERDLLQANSFTRLPTLIALYQGLQVEFGDWCRLLGEYWSCCDNISECAEDLWDTPFADIANDPAQFRHLLMDADEMAALDALPEQVTVYRGCFANNKWGLSWSVDRAIAERFPTLHRYRQEGQPLLVTARARKADIIALKMDRDELEVIAHRPKHISTRHL